MNSFLNYEIILKLNKYLYKDKIDYKRVSRYKIKFILIVKLCENNRKIMF